MTWLLLLWLTVVIRLFAGVVLVMFCVNSVVYSGALTVCLRGLFSCCYLIVL